MAHHRTTHGKSRTRIYRIWANMISRCDNPNVPCYARYGGAGVSYDPRWRVFANFYEDMGSSYLDELTLDRVDNKHGYNKHNCRWVSQTVQQNNKSTNVRHSYMGKTLTLTQWAALLNKKSSTLRQRYYVYKWPIDRVLGV